MDKSDKVRLCNRSMEICSTLRPANSLDDEAPVEPLHLLANVDCLELS